MIKIGFKNPDKEVGTEGIQIYRDEFLQAETRASTQSTKMSHAQQKLVEEFTNSSKREEHSHCIVFIDVIK
jgi:hypothetical protein